jgi:hypothetical protein
VGDLGSYTSSYMSGIRLAFILAYDVCSSAHYPTHQPVLVAALPEYPFHTNFSVIHGRCS